ncbi:MAG: TonB family protein [Hoeflea sp.]|nr:TonB family protein [Hoeflea sp.]
MNSTGLKIAAAVGLSLAMHVAAAAIFVPPEPTMEIAGGAATSQLFIGTAFEDSVMAGDPGEELKPVETPPDEAETVAPSDTASIQPVETRPVEPMTEAALEPAPAASLQPSEIAPAEQQATAPAEPVQSQVSEPLDSTPVIEAVPAQSEELASLAPVEEVEPAVEAEPETALPETIPVPVPRPEPTQTASAKPKPAAAAPQKPKAAQTKPEKTKPDREAQRTASKPKGAGDGGKQLATTSKASSGTVAAKRTAAAGNAAVSNYPGKVASKLRRSLRYPQEARRQGIRGEVVVSFVVASNGGVSNVRIARSSGSPVLDGAAAEAVRRAAPFPQIPADAGRSSWAFSVPLGFTR